MVKNMHTGIPLLRDIDFARGYGISPRFRLADGTFRSIPPWTLRSFPADARDPVWCFEEGVYEDFLDEAGTRVPELFEHRICVAGEVLADTGEIYEIGVCNRRVAEPKLIASFASNRRGTVRFFFNTGNMLRNVAKTHEPRFKRDTWPHFLIFQQLPSVPVAEFKSIPFQITARLLESRKLSDRMAGGPVPEKANFLSYFRLQHRVTGESLWVGICLFTSCGQERFYDELMSMDQHGTGMYRVAARRHGAPLVPGVPTTIEYDLRSALGRALDLSGADAGPDDYALHSFNLGWECIGDHQTLIECSGLSATGIPC